jgi:UPF0271 protein
LIHGHRAVPRGSDTWRFHHRDSRDGPLHMEPTRPCYLQPNSTLASASRHYGMRVVAEFFADRPYVDGQVVMFGWTAEQIGTPDDAALRVKTMLGSELGDAIGTVCVHTDTPGAVAMMAAGRNMLTSSGIQVGPPG